MPGKENIHADFLSRSYNDNIEWSISNDIFETIVNMFFVPSFDLFASANNTKSKYFYSMYPEIGSAGTDAFNFTWLENSYAFPPFSLIPKVLEKVIADRLNNFILICPFWPAQSWYPFVTKMLVGRPLQFSANNLYLSYRSKVQHPLRHMQLLGCLLSCSCYVTGKFQKKQFRPFVHASLIAQ